MSDDITISNPDPDDDASRLIGEEVADVSSAGTDETLDVADLLDAVAKERDEFKDLALRLQADFENFRKRVATQLGDDVDRATGKIVESILPVLDALQARCGWPTAQLQAQLLELELMGQVGRLPGGLFQRIGSA